MTDLPARPPVPAETVATGLDALLTVGRAGPARLLPGAPGLRLAAALAGRPATVARRGAGLAAELARIGLGWSTVTPAPGDGRYADPAWARNPLLRRLAQAHLAATATATGLVTNARLGEDDAARLRAAVETLSGALAPSNGPLHPEVLRTVVDTGGLSAVRGARRLLADVMAPPRVPAPAAPNAFRVGTDLAATPGAVVARTPVFELIQYLPRTELVHDVPLVVVPGLLNRYYLADLAPEQSMIEHLVRGGVQVFAISWRNPHGGHTHWDLDTYGQAVLDALDAVEHVARTGRSSVLAFGVGVTLTAMLLAQLAATGMQHRVAAVTLAGAALAGCPAAPDPEATDGHPTSAPAVAASAQLAQAFVAESERAGHLDGRALLGELAWRAPDALLWPQAVRTWLCGAEPARSEVLSWLADTTRAPAGLHRDLVDVALRGALHVPGGAGILGTPLDLAKIDRDCYLVAGTDQPVTPWVDVYTTADVVGGSCRFVLASGGRAASLVSPPTATDARHRAGAAVPGDPEAWRVGTAEQPGSWWDDHLDWLVDRSGPLRDAPPELGGRGIHALAPAPGAYVLER